MIKKQTFDTVLEKIRRESRSTAEQGKKFEELTKDFFKTDKLYKNRFKKVWLWKDWPDNDGQDTGIDLVAQEEGGMMCAIQCKCYADDGGLNMKAVSTFLAKAASLNFNNKILVFTGEDITSNAEKILRKSHCAIIKKDHLRESSVDWSDFPKIATKKPKKPFDYQRKAIDDVVRGFDDHDRGKMIMACGTGKTLVSLHIAEKIVKTGGIVLYLVPSISLILQSMREWSENANVKHYYVGVCSDRTAGGGGGGVLFVMAVKMVLSPNWNPQYQLMQMH